MTHIERTVEIGGRRYTIWCRTEDEFAARVKLLELAALEREQEAPVEEEP
ncbi:MAG: hypothetical protein WC683_01530 [bacterium]